MRLHLRLLAVLLALLPGTMMLAQTPRALTADTVVLKLELAPGEAPLQVTLTQMMAIFKDA
jgi:hypothetical protein